MSFYGAHEVGASQRYHLQEGRIEDRDELPENPSNNFLEKALKIGSFGVPLIFSPLCFLGGVGISFFLKGDIKRIVCQADEILWNGRSVSEKIAIIIAGSITQYVGLPFFQIFSVLRGVSLGLSIYDAMNN